jgi:probable HAF family extracellular repeat protein
LVLERLVGVALEQGVSCLRAAAWNTTSGRCCSNTGTIVGVSQTASGQWRSFVWRNGRMREIAVPGGESWAHDVNRAGVVVGGSGSSDGGTHAFAWDRGRAVQLPELGEYTVAVAVNDAGEIVGVSDRRVVLWRPDPVGQPAG